MNLKQNSVVFLLFVNLNDLKEGKNNKYFQY